MIDLKRAGAGKKLIEQVANQQHSEKKQPVNNKNKNVIGNNKRLNNKS
jgi:hypothetical protein